MKYILIITLFILTACTTNVEKDNDTELNIDIYKSNMTFEKFKQYVIEYAEKSPYPSLTNK